MDEIHTNDSETVIRVKCIIEPIYNTVHGTLTTQQRSNYANSNDVFLLNRLILNYHSEGTNQATLKIKSQIENVPEAIQHSTYLLYWEVERKWYCVCVSVSRKWYCLRFCVKKMILCVFLCHENDIVCVPVSRKW